ncbi:hypothetical protein [Alicyclobacillus sp. SO9]|uniref:hypothetical protein n=1 Tax=Alicyclobacillus sp. SO9 TaxID=2665646 RepID=UPI0018E75217|nr:hypothetical protein [Alicyclobacillus sp. SO9]QQE77576.1 hypothetical protein GI364_16735 [Alicyclobacillus sp. SO9]
MASIAQLYVSNHRIDCPNRGNIDLDICLFCENLIDVSLDNVQPFIRCTPPVQANAERAQGRNRERKRTARRNKLKSGESSNTPGSDFKKNIHTINKVISTSLRHPEWGISRVTETVQQQGTVVSRRKVGEIFKDQNMVYKEDRLRRLLVLAANDELELDAHQTELLNRHDLCFRDKHFVGDFPGHRLIQTSVAVPAKSIKAPLYADIVIDTYSGYTFGHIDMSPSRSSHVLLLQQSVFPFVSKLTAYPGQVFTPSSSIFSHRQFTEYLSNLRIEQAFFTETPGLVHQFWRAFLQPWVKAVPAYELIRGTNLQSHFQRDLDDFNHTYPLPGFPNAKRSPQTRIDGYLRTHT